ncbi:MAG TPA: adenylate/guanylate cyclase domain-containing protein, partial [Nitrospirales bacterium]|nr:adenylate/guanylate cyclase domain-containing protein [Nitrospirales bacterium]
RFGLPIDVVYPLEAAAVNAQFQIRGARDPGSECVLVVIDEKSLKEYGRWPWTRTIQAKLVEAISAGRPRVIGLDLIYAEPAPDDAALADSLQHSGAVVLAFPLHVAKSRESSNVRPSRPTPSDVAANRFMLVRHRASDPSLAPYAAYDLDPPVPALSTQAAAQGHVYFIPDRDGLTRYEYLALRYGDDDDLYPSFALEVARIYLGLPKDRESLTLGEGVYLGDRIIPTDQKARMLIDYAGPERTFTYISAGDVLRGRVTPETFAGKAVLVGTAALGTYDQKATPFSANFPGVEKNATVVENIVHGRFFTRTVWAGAIDAALIVFFAAALGAVLPRVSPLAAAGIAGGALVGFALTLHGLFSIRGMWLDAVYPALTIVATFVGITVTRLVTGERQAEEIRTMFSSYVSPAVVEELIRDPRKAAVGGRHKELTMVFCDLVGFTAFTETQSAEAAVGQLNEFLAAMTDVVFHWRGTVDKYVGDSIVAFWGAPLEQPNHAELGVKCALHMRKRLHELQVQWAAEGKPPLDCGIGINTGTAIVGNIGAEGKKLNYTMIGDQVNLAARVQELTRRYREPIIITESTARHLKGLLSAEERADNQGRLGHVKLRGLGEIQVRGRTHAVSVYALESLSRDEMSRVEESEGAPVAAPVRAE